MTRFVLLILISFFSTLSYSQEVYEWSDGICNHYGTINTSLTNVRELDNIRGLLFNPNDFSRPVLMNRLKDSAQIRLDLVEKECETYITELKTAEFPKGAFWDSIVGERNSELIRACELRKLAVIAIKHPDTLSSDKSTCHECKKWIKILQSDETTKIKAYKHWLGTEAFERLERSGKSTKELAQLATIDFMRFEWWNCVSQTIPSIQSHDKMEKQFRLLLKNVKTDCP